MSVTDKATGKVLETTISLTAEERDMLLLSVATYEGVLKRRINGEKNQTIRELLAADMRKLAALSARL